ncbi:hypothetical protein QBC40DRAFT_161102, partial [Triangularia verruculosa]
FRHSSGNMAPSSRQQTPKRLPPEIRLKIWREVWKPRTITISFEPRNYTLMLHEKSQPPVTLAISYEARAKTLKHYHRY